MGEAAGTDAMRYVRRTVAIPPGKSRPTLDRTPRPRNSRKRERRPPGPRSWRRPGQWGGAWRSWRSALPESPTPLAGMSHGAAGIAWALLQLAAATGDGRYREAARAGLAYERSLYDPERRNWPDLRSGSQGPNGEPHFMSAWCHGAPGIALARLDGPLGSGDGYPGPSPSRRSDLPQPDSYGQWVAAQSE